MVVVGVDAQLGSETNPKSEFDFWFEFGICFGFRVSDFGFQ